MAPAGDWISLQAALDAGCDAVYFGVQGMNMRAGTKNFPLSALGKIAGKCRGYNAKAYLALNILVYENEIARIKKIIAKAKQACIDAVICSDFAVIWEARKQNIPVHISTQMSVSNSESICFFYKTCGVQRFVLARECSLKDIHKIQKNLFHILGAEAAQIELEVFAHGAMCVSISGRCLISEFLFGKSANRGECLQPCRRKYRVVDKQDPYSLDIGSNYILSPKDICTLPFIEKLFQAGIASFKLEGRNRSPEYVSTVTQAYRQAVDFYYQNRRKNGFQKEFAALKRKLTIEVKKVYNRDFSTGFYLGKPLNQWTTGPGSQAPVRKEYVGVVQKYYPKAAVAEIKVESNSFKLGDDLLFQGPTTGIYPQKAGSIEVQHEKIDAVRKGMLIALKTEKRVRKNDKVFVMKPSR